MTRRPGEFQRAPWIIAPLPSKMERRISAMRNARKGPLRREAINDAGHDLFRLPGAQFGQGRIERCLAPNLRMRRRQKTPGLLAILPDVLGRGNNPRQSLGPFAFRGTQTFPPPFERRLRDDPVHHGALFGGIRKDVPRHVAKGCLGQATLDGVIQLQQGCDRLTQNAVAAQDFPNMAWLQHEYHYTLHFMSDDTTIDAICAQFRRRASRLPGGAPAVLNAVLLRKPWVVGPKISRAEIDSQSTPITPSPGFLKALLSCHSCLVMN